MRVSFSFFVIQVAEEQVLCFFPTFYKLPKKFETSDL